LALIGAAAALKNRTKVAGLIGRRSSAPEPSPRPQDAPVGTAAATPGPAPAPPVANADIPGPPTNTATAVPAPEPRVHPAEGGIDEAAEEAAAAAEAGNIGGPDPAYAGPAPGEAPTPADIPVEESGEGVSEGLEQAQADLADNAEEAAGDRDPAARRLEDTIEAQDDPATGENLDELIEADADLRIDDPLNEPPPGPAGHTLAPETFEDGSATGGGTLSGTTSAAEKSANVWKPEASGDEEDEGGSEWQTWSGQAVEPKD
jgi:hypothetical protein